MTTAEKLEHIKKYDRSDRALLASLKLTIKQLEQLKAGIFDDVLVAKINRRYDKVTALRANHAGIY